MIRSLTLRALLGLGLCLGASQANADVSLNTSPGLPAAGTPDTNGYTASFFTNAAINALTSFPAGLVGGAPAPTAGGLPGGTTGFTPVVVGPNGTFPVGTNWIANTNTSSWIGPNNHGQTNSAIGNPINGFNPATSAPQGYFYYDKAFNLATTSGVSLSGGLWATDNNGISIYLNGHFEANVTPSNGFVSFNSFSVNAADFASGTNHITFIVFNENFSPVHDSPTGVRVEGTVLTGVIPEPSTMAIAGLGAIGFIGFGLRRRKAKGA